MSADILRRNDEIFVTFGVIDVSKQHDEVHEFYMLSEGDRSLLLSAKVVRNIASNILYSLKTCTLSN